MTFLTFLASLLVKELLKTVGWRHFRTNFCLFSTILEKSSPQFPNSFRKSRSHTASQAKPLQGKWSYSDPLFMRFSSKSVENISIHMFSGAFLEKAVFHFRPSEVSFIISPVATGDMSPVATGERRRQPRPGPARARAGPGPGPGQAQAGPRHSPGPTDP